MVPTDDAHELLRRLLRYHESPWLEFEQSSCSPDMLGQCVSACANGAMLAGMERAFIVFGIENGTKTKVGTSVRLHELRKGECAHSSGLYDHGCRPGG